MIESIIVSESWSLPNPIIYKITMLFGDRPTQPVQDVQNSATHHILSSVSVLKLNFAVCGSLSKHRVQRVSVECPTECCHGSQRLALKNVGGRTKT